MIIQIQPWIDHSELEELKKVIDSTFITENSMTSEFEKMTKELTGAKHAIAVANGTVGLYCALLSLKIGLGDEVIVPNLTFIASSNAVIMAGAKPIFCEVNEDNLCINESKIESLINKNTKAIMPVHLYGNVCEMDKLDILAKKYNLRVIEDAAQGVGVHYKNQHVGQIGDIGVLSYYGNKTITTAEGGMILTNDDYLAKACYRLKNHGRDQKGTFKHDYIGFNFAYTDLQAAIGVSQMKKLKKIISKKEEIFNRYYDELKNIENIKFYKIKEQKNPVYWFTSIHTKKANELSKYLLKNGIQTRRFFYPLHLQPCYQNGVIDFKKEDFKTSEEIYNNSISLPSSYILKDEELEKVIETIKSFF